MYQFKLPFLLHVITAAAMPEVLLLVAGAGRYQRLRRMLVQAAFLSLCVALLSLGIAVAFPWWQYHRAAYPAVLFVSAGCFIITPVSFILGFAGFGGAAAALREDTEALKLSLAGCHLLQTHK